MDAEPRPALAAHPSLPWLGSLHTVRGPPRPTAWMPRGFPGRSQGARLRTVTPVDASRFPFVVVVLDASVDGPVQLAGVIRDLDAVLARREPCGFVFDYRSAPPATQQRVSEWLAERVDALRAYVRAAVTVVDADRLEHVQSLIGEGLFPMPFDAWATAGVDDAIEWLRSRGLDGGSDAAGSE